MSAKKTLEELFELSTQIRDYKDRDEELIPDMAKFQKLFKDVLDKNDLVMNSVCPDQKDIIVDTEAWKKQAGCLVLAIIDIRRSQPQHFKQKLLRAEKAFANLMKASAVSTEQLARYLQGR